MTSEGQPAPGELPDYGSVPPPPPGSPATSGAAPQQNKRAMWSMILGIVGLVGLCCTIGGFLGVPAIILGVAARNEIARSKGAQTGSGMATAGIVTGAIAALGAVAMIVFYAFDGTISGNVNVG